VDAVNANANGTNAANANANAWIEEAAATSEAAKGGGEAAKGGGEAAMGSGGEAAKGSGGEASAANGGEAGCGGCGGAAAAEGSWKAGAEAPCSVAGDITHALEPEMFTDIWKTEIPGSRKGKRTSIDFKDYAPLVFRRIRALFGISDREYMLSLGPEQILGELLLGTMGAVRSPIVCSILLSRICLPALVRSRTGSLAELFSEGKS
jgi:hypothetical protein